MEIEYIKERARKEKEMSKKKLEAAKKRIRRKMREFMK